MAKTKIEVDLIIKGGESVEQVENKTKSLKAQLKEIKALLASGTLDNQTFNKLSREAGELQDRIGDVSARVKNLASDSKRLDALMSAAQGLVGGFAAVQGVAALLGDENEDLQKSMVKLQGAMSALAGIQAVANTLNKESALSTNLSGKANIFNSIQLGVSSAAHYVYATAVGTSTGLTKAFRIALLATGVGAIIAGIVALAYAMDSMGDSTKDASEKLERMKKIREDLQALDEKAYESRDANRKAAKNGTDALKRELDVLVAKGATEKEIYEASRKLKDKESKDIGDKMGSLGETVELRKQYLDKENEILVLDESYKKGIRDKAEADKKKADEEAKKKRELDLQERIKRDQQALKDREQLAKNEKENTDSLAELDKEASDKEEQRKREDTAFNLAWDIEQHKYNKDQKKKLNAQELKDKQDVENAKVAIVNDSYLALNALGELALGQQFKNTNAGKALALAQIATDTALGFIQGLRIAQQSAIGLSGPAAALTMPVFYASQVAAVLGAANKAKALLGGGGGVSAPSGSGGGGGGSISSQPPRMDKFESNRPAMNPNQRVYVLEKDITDSQGRVARIRHNATLI
jgi:hypothetical protein